MKEREALAGGNYNCWQSVEVSGEIFMRKRQKEHSWYLSGNPELKM